MVEIKPGTKAWEAISPQYSENSENWTEPFIYLTSFGGQEVRLAFHAVCVNYYGTTDPGWYVDNVQIFPYITCPGRYHKHFVRGS